MENRRPEAASLSFPTVPVIDDARCAACNHILALHRFKRSACQGFGCTCSGWRDDHFLRVSVEWPTGVVTVAPVAPRHVCCQHTCPRGCDLTTVGTSRR
jgi:hypothetical protein